MLQGLLNQSRSMTNSSVIQIRLFLKELCVFCFAMILNLDNNAVTKTTECAVSLQYLICY